VKRKTGKCLLKLFAGVWVVLFVIWASVILWLGPNHVKGRLFDKLSTFWDGPIEIERIGFGFFGPITANSITLKDKTGRSCMKAEGMTLLFHQWPSRDPQLTGIALDRLDLRVHLENGGADFPFKKTTSSAAGQQGTSDPLETFTVNNLAVHLSNAKTDSIILDELPFSMHRNQTGYTLSVKQRSVSDSDHFGLSGHINSENDQIHLSLGFAKHISKKTSSAILSLLDLSLLHAFEGSLSADLVLTGTLAEFGDLQPAGMVRLTDGSIFKDQTVWAEELNTSVQINRSYVQVEKWTADSFGGQIEGSLEAEIKHNQLAQYHGQIKGDQLQASAVMGALTDTKTSSAGILAFDYTFAAEEGNLQQMKGQGRVTLDEVDYEMMRLAQKIIRTVSGNGSQAPKKSDALAIFETDGSIITFQKARLANDWVAMEVLPGGTLDIQTSRIDGHVIVALVKQIRDGLQRIPVVNLFAQFSDQMTSLRVQGYYSDMSNLKISKEPLRDVAKGTLDFFKGVATTGSDFIKTMGGRPSTLPKDRPTPSE
jgi:hypothetical protein